MPDGHRRSREFWTDTMEAGPPDPPAHVHRLPAFVRIALAGLLVAVSLLLIAVGFLTVYVYQSALYVQGRGEYRDREAARMEAETTEAIRRAMCDLLDTLPEGGLLQRPREKYGCRPGIPFDQLTPSEQAQLGGRARPSVAPPETPAAATPAPPVGTPAVPDPPRPQPETPTQPPEPPPAAPATSPAPELPLAPITDLLEEILP